MNTDERATKLREMGRDRKITVVAYPHLDALIITHQNGDKEYIELVLASVLPLLDERDALRKRVAELELTLDNRGELK